MASLPLTAGDVTTMNPAAEVITGYQRHELVGQPYSMLFDNTQFYSPVLDTLEHGTEHVALEISFPCRDRTIELSVTTSRIHNTHGEMIGALRFSDLTARKKPSAAWRKQNASPHWVS